MEATVEYMSQVSTVLGVIISLWAVVQIVAKILEVIRMPEKVQNDKLKSLESRIESLEAMSTKMLTFFKNDNERIVNISKGNEVTQKALLALLSHAIDGNNENQLKEARDKLQDYLIHR